jgi:rSAM/selenodomain-associated transferase 1
MGNSTSIIIFARYPELGKVKSRLAATTNQEFALRFYKECLSNLINEAAGKLCENIRISIYCTDKQNEMRDLYGDSFNYFLQCDGDLGAKMHHAFNEEFKSSSRVIIIGTDIPDLSAQILKNAVHALETEDSVIGETFDGGYYLLGLNRMEGSLFRNMPWSTSEIGRLTKKNLQERNMSYQCLETLRDIDTEEDFLKWKKTQNSE